MLTVIFTKLALKQFKKCPSVIRQKIDTWVLAVEAKGLHTVQQRTGYHDEPLQGKRSGQRSIRLNHQWRLIYEEKTGTVIEVQEVTAHDYRVR